MNMATIPGSVSSTKILYFQKYNTTPLCSRSCSKIIYIDDRISFKVRGNIKSLSRYIVTKNNENKQKQNPNLICSAQ